MIIEGISYVKKDRNDKSLNYTKLFIAAKSYPGELAKNTLSQST